VSISAIAIRDAVVFLRVDKAIPHSGLCVGRERKDVEAVSPGSSHNVTHFDTNHAKSDDQSGEQGSMSFTCRHSYLSK